MAERKSFLLRIDPALWADLEGWAQAELRSVNGQIEYILRQAVNKRKGEPSVPPPASQEPPTEGD
ncbi:MAG TPA: hypothetical protein VFF39_01645 [Verrucomicrobiae bacterium]|jgi:hypothetical protein|nr:hypothetical protein [Verrucomicrobiae bacterium]